MDKDKLWQKTIELIKTELAPHNFRAWIHPIIPIKFEEQTLTLAIRDAFIKNNLLSKYDTQIRQALTTITGQNIDTVYQIDPSMFPTTKQVTETPDDFFEIHTPNMTNQTIGLNPKYSLSNFVVGLTNNLAFAAAQAVAQNPGTTYNPLFIYGPSGVGKTHLMHAIGNTITAKDPRAKLVYVTSERFMNDFVDSIQNKKTNEFRSRYRNCSLLLIDDIQFIAGKDSTQEEFFHTFNELSTKNAQIVLTSDRPPNDMQKLETRLMSRFQGGLMVDIQLPDFDTRMAILRAKLSERGDTLPEEVLQLIAENITSNTRELEGKLISILSLLKLTNQPPTIEFIRAQIGKSTSTPGQTVDQKQVMTLIHRYFNIKPQDLTGPRRQKELVMPRQIAMYLLYEDCHLPFEKVGSLLGGRDHTTILHGVEKIKVAIDRDREIARIIVDLRQQLTN